MVLVARSPDGRAVTLEAEGRHPCGLLLPRNLIFTALSPEFSPRGAILLCHLDPETTRYSFLLSVLSRTRLVFICSLLAYTKHSLIWACLHRSIR